MWQKFKEQLPAVLVTVLLIGGAFVAYANYQTNTVIPDLKKSYQAQLDESKKQHAEELKAATEQTSREIEATKKMLADAISKREADLFRSDEEVQKLNTERMDALAAAIAKKVQPFAPVPKSPEEAERAQNEQVDKVSTRMAEKIQPILAQMATDQHITRESIASYSQKISDQLSVVLTEELAKNQQLNVGLVQTQGLARESLGLSHELAALYLTSLKDQGVITRILTLPANVIRDASQMSILNNSDKKKKETELIDKLNDLQKRLDAAQAQASVTPAK